MRKLLFVFFALLAMPLVAGSLEGEYGISGFDPETMEPYQGKAIIKENGDIYQVTWHIVPDQDVFAGTGIRKGNHLAVAFKNQQKPEQVGVQFYEIVDDDTLAGKWIFIGRGKKGSETLRRSK